MEQCDIEAMAQACNTSVDKIKLILEHGEEIDAELKNIKQSTVDELIQKAEIIETQ